MALNPEYAGTWEDAEGKISSTGFLEVNEDNLKLRLIGLHGTDIEEGVPLTGELSGIKIKAFDRFSIDKQIENLFSVSISGKYISLFNLRLRRSNSTIFAPPEETYYEFEAGYGLFGSRIIENKDRAIFTRSRFHIPDLHLVSSSSRFEHEYSNRRRISKSINILKDGTSDVFRIPEENIRIELYNGYHETSSRGLVKILPLTTITIVSRRGLTYEKHLEKFLRLENLISFMRGGPTNVEKVYLNTRKIIHRSKSVKIYEEFKLISRLSRRRNKKEDYIIRLSALENRSQIIHFWMTRDDNIIRLTAWFNYIWQNTECLVETQLVEYVSLLEILSTSKQKKGRFLEKSEFRKISKKLKSNLPNDLPEDIRRIFEGYIDRMNTKSQRLAIASCIEIIWENFQNYTDLTLEEFSKALSTNRNNISHGNFNSSDSLTAKDVKTIFYLKEFAKYIAYSLIALEIGINRSDVERTILEDFKKKQYDGKLSRKNFY